MIYILLAKLLDPVVVVVGLTLGRLVGSLIVAALLALVLTAVAHWLIANGALQPGMLLLGLVSAAFWTGLGRLLRMRAVNKAAAVAKAKLG